MESRPTVARIEEIEMDENAPEVKVTWLRFDDVECGRCRRWAGPQGDTVYVVEGEKGLTCVRCITDEEKARATR